ncbi:MULTISPECIES: hypothetical protein [unclassified Pseudoalteromonas]|uniref:hypothetical protein n=1 Tax=unclassified Pseudoalteromonas TaxID=194690 RepID=UPI0003F56172|nr:MULTISPECIES: hypothetical protein [unclassified Pseudoalteromonas]MBH0010718.1 hypothetical protein [Pseudoalteromonas sp. NZS100_1]MBH0074260.1 hypothetical protein [Pseudoalteromonas sp. SWYJ118]
MFLTEFFGLFSLSAFVMWAFLMAFFFNVFVYSLDVKRKTTLLLSSLIMMISYTATDYFYTWLSYYNTTYLDWAIHDLITIIVLIFSFKLLKKTTTSFLYLIVGLSINMLLVLLMYLDVYVYKNNEPWFFWEIYVGFVAFNDLAMVVALIVDRDFLGLHRIKRKLIRLFKSRKIKITT